jgi:hypothetical protein
MSFLNETIHLHKSPTEMMEVIKPKCDFKIFPCLESVYEHELYVELPLEDFNRLFQT